MWELVFQERLSEEMKEAEKVKPQTLGMLLCLPDLVCVRGAKSLGLPIVSSDCSSN